MTEPLVPLGYAAPLYYRHSGRFSIPGVLLAVVVGCVAAIAAGALYAYIDLYNPCISVLTFLATAGFGAGVGWVTGYMLRIGHTRNNAITVLVAALVAVVALYASWVVWVFAVLQQAADKDASFQAPTVVELVEHPSLLANFVVALNEVGVWSMGTSSSSSTSKQTVSGFLLAVVWLGEAAIIVGLAIWCAVHLASSDPYCERCARWCQTRNEFLNTAADNPAELKRRLESKDIAFLGQLTSAKSNQSWTFDLHNCDACGATHVLTARQITISVDRKGRTQKKSKTLVDKLLLTPEEAAGVLATR